MLRKWFSGMLVVVLLLSLSFVVFAQESSVRGNLGGSVLDQTGAVVSGAKVTINGPTGANTATTGGDGRFFFPVLTPGFYTVKVEKQGFRTAELKGVEVVTGRTASVSMAMQPGQVSETVEVSASAITVDTTSSAVGANLNDQFYSRVPVARNVTGIFYASPGVNQSGGAGAANPSISGGSGLENQYVADGVNITDGAFGGIGVFSRIYGSLSTGINLSFVKEVQVKTGGFEPQYGKSTGGLVQIVTKLGSNVYHGGLSAFLGPQQFEADRIQVDPTRLNQYGNLLHNGAYDISGEIGGYVPGLKDRVFFFSSFNPSWGRQYSQLAGLHGVYNFPLVGKPFDLKTVSYNYAEKVTFKLSDKHQIESSIFGDPTRSNIGPFNTTTTFSNTTFSKLANGTRNWVTRWNGTMSPTWLVNASAAWGHNYLTETPSAPNIYQIQDTTGCGFAPLFAGDRGSTSCRAPLTPGTLNGPLGPLAGIYNRQGLGLYENTEGDNLSLNLDTQKIINKLGSHTVSVGYHYEHDLYRGARIRSGPLFTITPNMAQSTDNFGIGVPAAAGLQSDAAAFQLRTASAAICDPFETGIGTAGCPTMFIPGFGDKPVYLRQTRGEFGNPAFNTSGKYHAAYVNDAWTINKHVTVSVGWRWEQQRMNGTPYQILGTPETIATHYTFTDNWSPRIGLALDPVGNKKTKIFGNYARYSYAIPLDMAIRSLSNELDFPTTAWKPIADASNRVVVNSDGTLANPVLDDAHFLQALGGASLSSTTSIAPGTKMQYLQEWVGGVEHEFGKGLIVNIRYIDRRLKRAVEDIAGISPEAFQSGLTQNYIITNPTPGTDRYINPIQRIGAPCTAAQVTAGGLSGEATDFAGDTVGEFCVTNAFLVDATHTAADQFQLGGALGSDGIPDGFVQPTRVYKGIEFEVNKSFSSGWQIRNNYRWSQLSGNYEGAFRNDNGQTDPSISSLFDFTRGDFNLLGTQFDPGWLNTDRRHIFNSFVSYSFAKGFLKNLTLGTGVRVESGIPINDLRAHPAYQNAGEIPVGGRGSLGRTPTTGQADVHADYAIKLNEKHSVHIGGDFFNITNQKTQLRIDQNEDRSFLVKNADFLKPTQAPGGFNPQLGFQRPFYARVMVKWVF